MFPPKQPGLKDTLSVAKMRQRNVLGSWHEFLLSLHALLSTLWSLNTEQEGLWDTVAWKAALKEQLENLQGLRETSMLQPRPLNACLLLGKKNP